MSPARAAVDDDDDDDDAADDDDDDDDDGEGDDNDVLDSKQAGNIFCASAANLDEYLRKLLQKHNGQQIGVCAYNVTKLHCCEKLVRAFAKEHKCIRNKLVRALAMLYKCIRNNFVRVRT